MKAMYIEGPGQVELIDVEKPVKKRDEALLEPLYGGIYGSNLGSYKGIFAYFNYPRIPGHEFSAEIVEADEDNEQGLRPGMIVACNPYFNCGHCYFCKNGAVNVYMGNQTMGCQYDGAFQRYIIIPSKRVHDGKGIDPMPLAMIEPFCISYHDVSQAEVGTREKVFVIGTGTVEVLVAVTAGAKGALVYISDVPEGKLEIAKAFGVDNTILNDSLENFEKAVNDIVKGNGFNTAIETAELPSTFQNCVDTMYFGGKVVVIGVGKRNLDSNFILLQKKGLNVLSSRNALKKDFVKLIDLARNGETPTENIITSVHESEDGTKALYDFAYNPGDMLKVVIDFTGN